MNGSLAGMSAGQMGPVGDATELKLVIAAAVIAIPAVMIFLSSSLPAKVSRWLNIVFGAIML